ncbi:MAG: hypothetical protein U0470_02645 [Anaerolineae bacterium]
MIDHRRTIGAGVALAIAIALGHGSAAAQAPVSPGPAPAGRDQLDPFIGPLVGDEEILIWSEDRGSGHELYASASASTATRSRAPRPASGR